MTKKLLLHSMGDCLSLETKTNQTVQDTDKLTVSDQTVPETGKSWIR